MVDGRKLRTTSKVKLVDDQARKDKLAFKEFNLKLQKEKEKKKEAKKEVPIKAAGKKVVAKKKVKAPAKVKAPVKVKVVIPQVKRTK